MRVLFVASECYPLIKTGGLADVCGALPAALRALGVDARLVLPGYPAVLAGLADPGTVWPLADLPGAPTARLVSGRMDGGVPVYALDAPGLYDRPGNPYLGPDGRDWPDNHLRFAALGWAAAWLCGPEGGPRWRPDLVHAHDWQAGLAPAYLALGHGPRPAAVTTIHNIAYQGLFPPDVLGALHLPPESFSINGVEFYGRISFLKAGLFYADRITTVSPTYAREIQTPDGGAGLHGLLSARSPDLWGILNGIDERIWNPATDAALVAPYDADSLDRKTLNKAALQDTFGLDREPEAPLFAVVSRLTEQKGMDLLLEAVPHLVAAGGQLVLLGVGDGALQDAFARCAEVHPGRVGVFFGYDEVRAHRIQGGADLVVMPSRFEPCGLVQMYALRYGTVPLVRRVGGLADTVVDATPANLANGTATGIVFDDATRHDLVGAIGRALALYRQPDRWRAVQRTGMAQEFSWARAARRYLDLYRTVCPGL